MTQHDNESGLDRVAASEPGAAPALAEGGGATDGGKAGERGARSKGKKLMLVFIGVVLITAGMVALDRSTPDPEKTGTITVHGTGNGDRVGVMPDLSDVQISPATLGAAIEKAKGWLGTIVIDPVALQKLDIKGKKKMVELLDAYVTRWRTTLDPAERAEYLERIKVVVQPTSTAQYHNMGTVSDREFKQSSLSYLRACYLMEEVGLDTSMYRAEIAKIRPRLDPHVGQRGVDQRMTFHLYYKAFGMDEPLDLAAAFKESLIVKRVRPQELTANDVYQLTHEVFSAYGFGRLSQPLFMSDEDVAYTRGALDELVEPVVSSGNPDLAAELVISLHLTGGRNTSGFITGVKYLLQSQKSDGSWGNYDQKKKEFGDMVKIIWELHTTGVALKALSYAAL